jgi:exodeoxyribonuclease VII large subunit
MPNTPIPSSPPAPEIWSVSQLTRRIKSALELQIGYVWLSGEISNWRVSPAGHAYFTLKDANSQIDAVMFRGKMMQVRFGPDNGLEVIVHGQVTVYERRGNYQIICEEMQPKGMGALQLAFERLKAKLDGEGLFAAEHKKPLPMLPRRIGIVTSPTGAAIRDMLNVINRRFALVHIILYPTRVQGDEAAEEIVEGIRVLDQMGVDVMIVGRGGGSLEDLWPFNEELVVRAVYECQTPIISAVGHEIDFALSDFAADLRAPTPSAAAELVVREQDALLRDVCAYRDRLVRVTAHLMGRLRQRLEAARRHYIFRNPEQLIVQRRQQTDELRMHLQQAMVEDLRRARIRVDRATRSLALLSPRHQMQRATERLAALRRRLAGSGLQMTARTRARLHPLVGRLDALSPLAILARGYAVAWKLPERALVRRASQLTAGDTVALQFGEGSATARIERVSDDEDKSVNHE